MLSALDAKASVCALRIASKARPKERYSTLKDFLIKTFSPSRREQVERILSVNELGDRDPSVLANHPLTSLGDFSTDILIHQVFLHSLPIYVQDDASSINTKKPMLYPSHRVVSALKIKLTVLETLLACSHQVMKTCSGLNDTGHGLGFLLHSRQEKVEAVQENAKHIVHNSTGTGQSVVKDSASGPYSGLSGASSAMGMAEMWHLWRKSAAHHGHCLEAVHGQGNQSGCPPCFVWGMSYCTW